MDRDARPRHGHRRSAARETSDAVPPRPSLSRARQVSAVRVRAADAELGQFAEAAPGLVVGQDLGPRPALLDQRREFEERVRVEAGDGEVRAARVLVHHEQRLAVRGQPEELPGAAEVATPDEGARRPGERGADGRGEEAEQDVAYVVRHGARSYRLPSPTGRCAGRVGDRATRPLRGGRGAVRCPRGVLVAGWVSSYAARTAVDWRKTGCLIPRRGASGVAAPSRTCP